MLSQDSRNVCLTIAAYLNDFLQAEVRVQTKPLLHKCLLYAVDNLQTGLFGSKTISDKLERRRSEKIVKQLKDIYNCRRGS